MSRRLEPALALTTPPHARPSALTQVLKRRPIAPGPGFAPLPAPRGPAPFRRRLSDVLEADVLADIARRQTLRLHCVGDTGGWQQDHPQRHVAGAMAADLAGPERVHGFYHLGDVVYPHGEDAHYESQFFAPYREYAAPIFAIPGNHDGEAPAEDPRCSLSPFLRTFCSRSHPLHDAAVPLRRRPADQPHVHWTLVHDWLWIIGLYTNVPEDGEVAAEQLDWLTGELVAAPPDVTVIVAMHRPVYSVDVIHGSNLELGDALDACFARAGRVPDAVLGAHAHNYQRFARRLGGRSVPYVVAGAGGFHQRHPVGAGLPRTPVWFPGLDGVTLEAHQDAAHGYLTVSVSAGGAVAAYRTVSGAGTEIFDAFPIRRQGAVRLASR